MASNTLVSISTACSARGRYDVLGIVVDSLPIYRTRGSSNCVTFTIKDSDFDKPTWTGGLKVKYFNDNQAVIPMVQVNDVILLRNLRVRSTLLGHGMMALVKSSRRIAELIRRSVSFRVSRLASLLKMTRFTGPSFDHRQDLAGICQSVVGPSLLSQIPMRRKERPYYLQI